MSSFPAPIQSGQGRLEASCAMKKRERQGQEVSPGLGADSEFGAFCCSSPGPACPTGGWKLCGRKLGLSVVGAKSNPGDTVLGEVEKDHFITLPAKGRDARLLPWKAVANQEDLMRIFIKVGPRWSLTRLGWEQGSWSPVQLFVTPWTVAPQVPLSMGFSRQEY